MNKKNDLIAKEAFDLAVQNHKKNNLQDAQNHYNKVLKIDPNHLDTLNNLGVIFKKLGEYQKAINCYEKTIEINPNYLDAHNNLGIIFKELEENQKAIGYYEKAIKINPNYINAHNNLGIIFQDLGEHQKAIGCYESAIEINPNYSEIHHNLGTTFRKLKEYQKAKASFEKAIEINPNNAMANNNLGIIFENLEEPQKAKKCFEKAIMINPNYVDAYYNLGILFNELGEPQKAKDCYEKVIEINPNYENVYVNLSVLLGSCRFDYKSKNDKTSYKKLIISLFNKGNVDTISLFKNTKLILFSDVEQNQLEEAINSNSLLSNKILQSLLKEELFHLLLQKSILADNFLEKLLTQLRSEILFNLENSNKDNLKEYLNLIISFAEQCWLNEYLYDQSEKEINIINKLKQKIENDEEINELEMVIFGCYMPLNSSKIIIDKLLNYKSSNLLFNDLISVQIEEPLMENELVKSIQSLEKISDPVSKKVQEQYEENPYPRWRCTNKVLSQDLILSLNKEIEPNKIKYNDKFNNPNILVAGCGTGKHSILVSRYKNSNILAVDLSLTSLAYAKRKTEELDIKNIEYLHADILQLQKLNKKFDIIESAGTLHHMEDPVKGLKVLVDILEPHGFLKLGLYSETARRCIVEAREFIKKKNYKNTNKDIKICRQDIINEKVSPLTKKIINARDFYSTSAVRDLLFHVQEHQFTIPQISKILKDLNLEFLGFYYPDPIVKKKFSQSFPEDKNNISLDNWHQFEINNPDIFCAMYQFWVRKI